MCLLRDIHLVHFGSPEQPVCLLTKLKRAEDKFRQGFVQSLSMLPDLCSVSLPLSVFFPAVYSISPKELRKRTKPFLTSHPLPLPQDPKEE